MTSRPGTHDDIDDFKSAGNPEADPPLTDHPVELVPLTVDVNRSLVDDPLLQLTYHNTTGDSVRLGHGVSFHERNPAGGLVAAFLSVARRLGTDPAHGETVWPVGSSDSVFDASASLIEPGNEYVGTVALQEVPDGEYLAAHAGTSVQPDSPWVTGLAVIQLGSCPGAAEPTP